MAQSFDTSMFDMDFLKKMMPLDFSGLMETQRKNMETLTEAQQLMMSRVQEIGRCQAEMISKIVEDQTTIAQQLMSEGTPEEKVARQTDLMCKSFEHSVEGMNELSNLINQSGKDATEILTKRVTASLTEFKSTLGKKPGKEKAAA